MGSMAATFMSLMGHETTSYMYINYTGACSWCVHLMFTQQDCIHVWAALLNSSVLWCTIMGLQATMWHMSQHWKKRCSEKKTVMDFHMGCWLPGDSTITYYNYVSFFNHNYLGWVRWRAYFWCHWIHPLNQSRKNHWRNGETWAGLNIALLTGEKRGWYYLV